MTGTKRLSLHGRLRMAAACPDPNAALLAEAADAIEQHEAFRQEVSDAVRVLDEFITGSEDYKRGSRTDGVHLADGRSVKFARFIVAKPDPLVEALEDLAAVKAREAELRACLGFFASVIKSGEPWTATCEQRYRAALLQENQHG